ncbi:hypothetical protein EGI26_00225 [Lacihabitans sp. CCS-44]|nr:hypothetical protein [Lacihabitans sp. CCS-44]
MIGFTESSEIHLFVLVEFPKLVKIGGFRSNTIKVSDFKTYEITCFVCLARRAFFFSKKKNPKKHFLCNDPLKNFALSFSI